MTFQTFEISELPPDSEDDYAVEIQASSCKFGVLLKEDEMKAMAEAMLDSVDDEWDRFDGKNVSDIDV